MIEAFFDGSCENGLASYGALVRRNGETLWQISEPVLGKGTCNLAEYAGFIAILRWLIERGMHHEHIVVRGDSQLVIQQMFGHWKVRKGIYAPFAHEARSLLRQFSDLEGEWIPRQRNAIADSLSRLNRRIDVVATQW